MNERIELWESALVWRDREAVSDAAYEVGRAWVELRYQAADMESSRTLLRFNIAQRLREEGKATSEKAAEQMAKEDAEYTQHLDEQRRLEHERDRLEVLYHALVRRTEILGER